MKVIAISALLTISSLVGCASMLPASQTIRFANDKAELKIEKNGCAISRGQFTDLSGQGSSGVFLKFIAVTNDGQTVGQWYASCKAVVPGGTSACAISGTQKAYFECANYDTFRLVN